MIRKIYTHLAALLVRLLVRYCTWRGRYVDYIHPTPGGGQGVYMRRYVIAGFMTGDPPVTGLRAWLPNLYLHQMRRPDADASLHDHPWPWAVSFILLGGYREERLKMPSTRLPGFGGSWIRYFKRWGLVEPGDVESRWHRAPAINVLSGRTFHRVAELAEGAGHGPGSRGLLRALETQCTGSCNGTWTLFLAGPRRGNKPWGYIVDRRGYVPQQTRHLEVGACERRAPAVARAECLTALANTYGIKRRKVWRLYRESDRSLRWRVRRARIGGTSV